MTSLHFDIISMPALPLWANDCTCIWEQMNMGCIAAALRHREQCLQPCAAYQFVGCNSVMMELDGSLLLFVINSDVVVLCGKFPRNEKHH